MDLTRFKALTFDVYGTLIDWETGIWNALQPLFSIANREISREEALETYGDMETRQEAETPSLHYRTLLAVVHARLARHWGIAAQADLHERFGASVPDWPAFPDSREALAYLKQHFRLVVISNIDSQSFAASNRKLGVSFDAVYTAAFSKTKSFMWLRVCSMIMRRQRALGWPAFGSTAGSGWRGQGQRSVLLPSRRSEVIFQLWRNLPPCTARWTRSTDLIRRVQAARSTGPRRPRARPNAQLSDGVSAPPLRTDPNVRYGSQDAIQNEFRNSLGQRGGRS